MWVFIMKKYIYILCLLMTVALSSCGMSKNTAGTDNGQIKLKIAAIYSAGSLSDDILKFKKDNPGIDIEVKTYESYAEPERSFIMDLTSGDLPDVIVAPRNILFKLAKRGLIEDIYPYIDSDKELSREDFLPSVLNAYEIDGKLYQTVSLVNLHSWATDKNEFTTTGRWNLESFKNYIEGNKEKKVLVSYSMDGISKAILTGVLSDYIDWEEGKCDFINEKFYELMDVIAYVREHSDIQYEQDQDSEPSLIEDGGLLFKCCDIDEGLCSTEYLKCEKVFKRNAVYLGPPVSDGSATSFGCDVKRGDCPQMYSLVSGKNKKDEAWKFVRYFLAEDYQKLRPEMISSGLDIYGFPTRKDSFEDYLKRYTAKEDYTYNGETVPVEERLDVFSSYTEELGEKYRDLVNNTDRVDIYDDQVMGIAVDELNSYFSGERSKEDAAKHIQSRVEKYLAE